MEYKSIPEWMTKEEQYEPKKDADGFMTKSMLQMMGVLAKARKKGGMTSGRSHASFWLCLTIYLIILVSCSRNIYFHGCVLAGILIRLCLISEKSLLSVWKTALSATFFSMLVLLPAAWMGSMGTLFLVSGKVFLSVSLVSLLTETLSWNALTQGMKGFHVPDIFIFTLDITLKYIVILGEVCIHMLQALQLRSVGKNRKKGTAFAGILGTAFLKSQTMAEETYQAMVCRGFEGTYRRPVTRKIKWWQILAFAGITAGYIFLER